MLSTIYIVNVNKLVAYRLREVVNFIRDYNDLNLKAKNHREREWFLAFLYKNKDEGATLNILNLPSLRGIEDPNLRQLMNNLILELYKYQAEGRYHGRKPKYSKDSPQLQHVFRLYKSDMTNTRVVKLTGINRATLIRYRKKLKSFINLSIITKQ